MKNASYPEQSVPPRSVILGTAGHIDHGKTALVLALTGADTDRLPEEKARGITIDLGFAAMELKDSAGQLISASVIDVPGHHAFLRNMLAGTGGIDAVMLVVAADEGVRPQTVEHLQICALLGIERGLVVLTKQDAASMERLAEVEEEVRTLLRGTFLQDAAILTVSAVQRIGISPLKMALGRLAASVPARSGRRVARLPIDRAFSVRGFGTVVTGTLQDGMLRSGQPLVMEPGARPVRVRGLQVHGKARSEVAAPNRVALNLTGLEVNEIARGNTLVPAQMLEPTDVLDIELHLLPGKNVQHRQRVRVHAFASECLATMLLYPGRAEGTGETASEPPLARLRLSRRLLLVPGDRLVLRQPSPASTLGGGQVLDATPLPRLRKASAADWLRRLREAGEEETLLLRVQRRAEAGIGRPQLVTETGWTSEAIADVLRRLLSAGKVAFGTGEAVVSQEALLAVQTRVMREMRRAEGEKMSRAELRGRFFASEAVLELALQRLQAEEQIAAEGDLLRLGGRMTSAQRATAPDARMTAVEGVYFRAGLASPLVGDVAQQLGLAAGEIRAIVTGLLRTGRLIRLGSDALLVHVEALQALRGRLAAFKGTPLDVGQFKKITGLTRKHAIPLLEYLDGARVTRNAGGVRTVL